MAVLSTKSELIQHGKVPMTASLQRLLGDRGHSKQLSGFTLSGPRTCTRKRASFWAHFLDGEGLQSSCYSRSVTDALTNTRKAKQKRVPAVPGVFQCLAE
jgi:hypothetical protein